MISSQYKRHCSLICARNDSKTHQKKNKKGVKIAYSPSTELEQVPVLQVPHLGWYKLNPVLASVICLQSTVATFKSCIKCLGRPGIIHDRTPDCHLVSWAWMRV